MTSVLSSNLVSLTQTDLERTDIAMDVTEMSSARTLTNIFEWRQSYTSRPTNIITSPPVAPSVTQNTALTAAAPLSSSSAQSTMVVPKSQTTSTVAKSKSGSIATTVSKHSIASVLDKRSPSQARISRITKNTTTTQETQKDQHSSKKRVKPFIRRTSSLSKDNRITSHTSSNSDVDVYATTCIAMHEMLTIVSAINKRVQAYVDNMLQENVQQPSSSGLPGNVTLLTKPIAKRRMQSSQVISTPSAVARQRRIQSNDGSTSVSGSDDDDSSSDTDGELFDEDDSLLASDDDEEEDTSLDMDVDDDKDDDRVITSSTSKLSAKEQEDKELSMALLLDVVEKKCRR